MDRDAELADLRERLAAVELDLAEQKRRIAAHEQEEKLIAGVTPAQPGEGDRFVSYKDIDGFVMGPQEDRAGISESEMGEALMDAVRAAGIIPGDDDPAAG